MGSLKRERKALLGYWFEEIIDRCDFERPDRILVVRGHEDDWGHALRSNGVNDRKSVSARHLDIEEDEVQLSFTNESNGLTSVARL